MADEKPKQTYDELAAENAKLKAGAKAAEGRMRTLQAQLRARDAEIAVLRRGQKAKRVLDKDAASPYDRPFDGFRR